jgi:hypothetical protein
MVKTLYQGGFKNGHRKFIGSKKHTEIWSHHLSLSERRIRQSRVYGVGSGTFSKWNEKEGKTSFDKSEEKMLT